MQDINYKWPNLHLGSLFVLCLAILTATIFFMTLNQINSALYGSYLFLTLISFLTVYFSFSVLTATKIGTFNFLLSILFYLGFFFKFSFHSYTNIKYREPIGLFQFSNQSIQDVLLISTIGILPLLLISFIIKKINLKINYNISKLSHYYKISFLLICAVCLLSFLNLKYNILLFALAPATKFPFGGNAIYFLLLTRVIIFLFISYCFQKITFLNILIAGVIVSISSIGILSRMGTVTFIFFYFSLYLIFYSGSTIKKTFFRTLIYFFTLISLTFFVVVASSELRSIYVNKFDNDKLEFNKDHLVENQANTTYLDEKNKHNTYSPSPIKLADIKNNSNFSIIERIHTFTELALQRWIGIEGVMAIYSIENKNFKLILDAFTEKSYQGNSFYNKHARPNLVPQKSSELSTSVPGPVAFFYYPGNLPFLFFGFFAILIFLNILEIVFSKLSLNFITTSLFSTFVAFDFFQFGISPISFFKYLFFTFSVFLIIEKSKKYFFKVKYV
jgi:hypothetical protein